MAEIFHDIHATPFGDMPGPGNPGANAGRPVARSMDGQRPGNRVISVSRLARALALLICLGIPQALLKGLLLVGAVVAFLVGCQIAFTYGN